MIWPGSLEPDSEQQLFEKLSMSEEELKELQFIRERMKRILKEEGYKNKENNGN